MMKLINERRASKHYFDKLAFQYVHNKTEKAPLTESPFVSLFECGESNGYWCRNHIVVQTEDYMDCLTVIFEGRHDFLFLYYHSRGHTKKIGGGLYVTDMNKNWGVDVMIKTLVKYKKYLGPYHEPYNPGILKVREEQTLVYESETDL